MIVIFKTRCFLPNHDHLFRNTIISRRRQRGILEMLLAAIGLYGVMSYLVNQNTYEIGIRLALGAQSTNVIRMVVRQGLTLAGTGIAAGLAGAFALTRVMTSLLFGVTALDPASFVFVALMLALIAVGAIAIPASRVVSVDPVVALRQD